VENDHRDGRQSTSAVQMAHGPPFISTGEVESVQVSQDISATKTGPK